MYHNLEIESWSTSELHGRYVTLCSWWDEWEVTPGFGAVLSPDFDYIGSTYIKNPDSAWWVIHCTSWATKVGLFLVWVAFDIGLL